MRTLKNLFLISFFTLLSASAFSQSPENLGWLFITHTQKLSKKLDALADVQVGSSNNFIHFENLLLRGGVGYNLNKKHSIAAGYTYSGEWTEEDGKITYNPEHWISQQYVFNTNIKRTEITLRFRQEQRFIKEEGNFNFSQRSRAFFRVQIPLAANATFTHGLYSSMQNEIFINVQPKEKVNKSFFDQNIPFISIGYRWNKKIDTEIGYIPWVEREPKRNVFSNVYQCIITTEL